MDYRGYGGMRDAPGDYTIDEIATDALALADKLGFASFSLIGHSMGGMAIERIAALAPERDARAGRRRARSLRRDTDGRGATGLV